jgi:Questin oxidase-like
MNTAALHALIERSLQRLPEYRGGLSNHAPMALHALSELGADDQRLHDFFNRYAQRLEGRSADAEPLADWPAARGRIDAFDALRAGFERMLHAQGAADTLHRVLPALWPGVASAAFHGLIRSAHGLQSGHPGELAAGLAYWAARWQPCPEVPAGEALSFAAWSDRLEAAALRTRTAGGLITQRMETVVRGEPYRELAAAAPADAATLRDLADWAASVYARSGNFTVLHMVTASRAARVLLPHSDDPAAAWLCLVRAFAAAALASNLQQRAALPSIADWDELRAAAIASDDEHVIKLVHACIDESAVYGEGIRRAAAARAQAQAP